MLAAGVAAFDEASPETEEVEEEEDDTTVVSLVDLTDVAVMNESEEMERFAKMCEDMATAIDEREGPGEISQPWLGEPEEWVQRTPEVSDNEAI